MFMQVSIILNMAHYINKKVAARGYPVYKNMMREEAKYGNFG